MGPVWAAEAARLLRVSERTVRRLLVAGELAGFRIGAQWRIGRTALDARLLQVPPRHMTHDERKR